MKAIDVTQDNVQMSKSVAKVGPLLVGIGLASLGLSAGLGLQFKGLKLDYSLSQYGDLGTTGQFGIGIKF